MGIAYDSSAVFGWTIDEKNEDKFRKVLKEVFNYEKADDFSFWQHDDIEEAEEKTCGQFGPFRLILTGNFYCDTADAFVLLFGKNCEWDQLAEVIDWFETNKEIVLKIEKIMEEPPRFVNEWTVW